jgi:hypothetical protein
MADVNNDANKNDWTIERVGALLPVFGLTLRMFVLEARVLGESEPQVSGMLKLLGVSSAMGIPFALFQEMVPSIAKIGYWQGLPGSPEVALEAALRSVN